MKTNFVAALLLAFSASVASPAFASGYGPAPSYRSFIGAPVSQRGQSTQSLAANNGDAQLTYGGVFYQSQSTGPAAAAPRDTLYIHR